MNNITASFIYYAIFLAIILIALDFAYLRLRMKHFKEGDTQFSVAKLAFQHIEKWVDKLKARLPQPQWKKFLPSLPKRQVNAVAATPPQTEERKEEVGISLQPVPAPESTTPAKENTVHVQISADIPEGTVVHITLEAIKGEGQARVWHETLGTKPLQAKPAFSPSTALSQSFQDVRKWFVTPEKWGSPQTQRIFFIAAIAIYLLVVSIGIDRFPIYFFTDEAVHANLAANFWNNGLENNEGEFLPTYFSIDPSFGLNGISVYLQVLPYALFGKSVVVTRMVSALITLLGAILVGLLLKQVFKLNSYWLGILLLITSPAWFLHARTAFEYMEVAAFFAATLYFYNRYRQGENGYLYATVIAGALTFYTHGLGQVLIGLTALLLFLSDLRYHFQPERRKVILFAAGLAILLFLPYVRYNLNHPEMITAQIKQRASYWMNTGLSFQDKTRDFLSEYLYGIDPFFWFLPNSRDIPRHVMKGYGDILLPMLPFAAIGLVRAIYNFRKPEYRSVLIALLVAPVPASIVAVGTPRVLWMIVPWTILIALGFDWTMQWLDKSARLKIQVSNLALFVLLSLTSIYILNDALQNGPLWYQDYGLYGMQYGAKQVFQDTVVTRLRQDPNISFMVSPSWANGTGELATFFVPPELSNRMHFGTPNDVLGDPRQVTPNTFFILTPDEFANFSQDPKIKELNIQGTIPYPNGKPGFYLTTLQFAGNIDEIMAAEHLKQRTPVEDAATINGQIVRLMHSPIGGGRIQDTFDGNPDTLTRVTEANPDVFDLYPDPPLDTHSITIQTGSLSDFTVTVSLYAPGSTEPVTYSETYKGLPPDPLVTINFDRGPAKSGRIYIEIKDNTSGETSQIHVRTIQFK